MADRQGGMGEPGTNGDVPAVRVTQLSGAAVRRQAIYFPPSIPPREACANASCVAGGLDLGAVMRLDAARPRHFYCQGSVADGEQKRPCDICFEVEISDGRDP